MFASVRLTTPFTAVKYSKKINEYLGIILSQFHSSCKNCDFDRNIFENARVQKYLNYITNDNSNQNACSNLREITELLERKKNVEKELLSLKNMSSDGDEELKKLIESEKQTFLDSIEQIENELLSYMIPEDEDDNRNVELQIFSGIGGDEAKLFRNELLTMYLNYAAYKNWDCVQEPSSEHLFISGDSVFEHLRHEGGVHRVQRVPETEKQDRTHTSTCSVVILPQPKPHEIVIKDKDLIIETMRSSGPGGQRVNKSESCVRIKHIPSGITVESQTSRFQYENKKIAIEKLRSTLFNIQHEKEQASRKSLIKGQAGTNDYADKIRTYQFQQNRVTDHRLNYSIFNVKGFLSGTKDLDAMINRLKEFHRKKSFLTLIEHTLQTAKC